MKARKKSKCKCGCGRKRSKRGLLSEVCKSRIWRAKNPMRHAYNNIKYKAPGRRLEFTISFERFKQLCIESGYIEGKGKEGCSLTIDRIRNLEGYTDDNVQVITRSANSTKRHTLDAARLKDEGIYIAEQNEIVDPF